VTDDPAEVPQTLADDGVTHVVRIGRTVRRPVRPFTATIQGYLAHVRSRGFLACPEPLGYDDEGREVLGYVAGDVPAEPLPDYATTTDALTALGALVRRLHDAADGWTPPADAVWGGTPGVRPAGVVPLFEAPELVAHMDYCPGNVVFAHGRPVALIDFDLARPTTRVADLANALYWWAPLLHPLDRAPALVDADVPARVRAFADAYGMTAAQRAQLVPVANRMVANFALTSRAAAEVDPVFRRWWDEGVKDRMPRAVDWLAAESPALRAQL
jgi:Ser/Thr protein kinase RdoA (MazF antagonist)